MQNRVFLLTFTFLLGCMFGPANSLAQPPGMENMQPVSEGIMQARGQNMQALKAYAWNQRTEVIKEGEVMTTKLELVRYDSSGNEQRSVLSEQKPEQKKRLAGRIQKKKMAEMQAWGEEVKSLLMKYTLPDAASLDNFLGKASIQPVGNSGQIVLHANNVIQQGDRMTMDVNAQNKQILKTEIFTNHEGDSVHMEIDHALLPEDIVYTSELRLAISTKNLKLKVENFNYNRN